MDRDIWDVSVLDMVLAAILVVFLAGVFADGRSHIFGAPVTFFTLEHAVFYTAFAVMAGVFGLYVYHWKDDDTAWLDAVPDGHRWTAIGFLLFGFGGLGDMLWHGAFGIESTTEALYSPSHLMLAAGAVLFVSGPLRSAWNRDVDTRWRDQWPLVVSAAATLSIFTFMTMYAHPIVQPHAAVAEELIPGTTAAAGVEVGILGFMLYAALLTGVLLYMLHRFTLVPGAFTAVIVINTVLMGFLVDRTLFVPAGVIAGVVADGLYQYWAPSPDRTRQLLLFTFIVPAAWATGYFTMLAATGGIAWTVHVWTGAIALAGIVGLLVGYLATLSANDAE